MKSLHQRNLATLVLAGALGLVAWSILDMWSQRNAPVFKRFERQWREDVLLLEKSQKLPKAWFDLGSIEIFGGTPETKELLQKVTAPFVLKSNGAFHLDILIVYWNENGQQAAMVQYNLKDKKTNNQVTEIGRTLVLTKPKGIESWIKAL